MCRPSAYDTVSMLLEALKCEVLRVVITECTQTVFYARVHARSASAGTIEIDARPSTAINIALRAKAPVWVHKTVVAQFGKTRSA